jgi:enamine deaminase RidA (YjgF/YER057c/UK114 family)
MGSMRTIVPVTGLNRLVFMNIAECLSAHGADMGAVVKLTAYLLPGQDVQVMREIRSRHFGHHRPTSTSIYVPQLVDPKFLLEIEAVAVKPLRKG